MTQIYRMPDFAFHLMVLVKTIEDKLHPKIEPRVASFGISEGMTVVDYGCGPGRYTTRLAQLVGSNGRVYAVDVQELAIETVKRKMARLGLQNIIPVLVHSYATGIPDHCADVACAIDVFHGIGEPTAFLREIHRMVKPAGFLIIDDGHQPRPMILRKIEASGCWRVAEDTRDHLKCLPVQPTT